MYRNAREELLSHVSGRDVKYVKVVYGRDHHSTKKCWQGTLDEVLEHLDFGYYSGCGSQELFGTIWYTDGTWSERDGYYGSEWWAHYEVPELPDEYYL